MCAVLDACSGPYGMQDPNFLANGLLGGSLANSLGAGALADSLGLTQVDLPLATSAVVSPCGFPSCYCVSESYEGQ